MLYGTNPAVIGDFDAAPDVLGDYVEGILFKDIFRLTEIRVSPKFQDLVLTLCHRIGSEVNYESLGRDVGLNRETVQRYLMLLELSSIIRVVPSYSTNLPNELKKGKKVYFTDLGIRNALLHDFSPLSERRDAARFGRTSSSWSG